MHNETTIKRQVRRSVILSMFGLAVCVAGEPGPPLSLTVAERAGLSAYLAELRSAAGSDTIIDTQDPSLRDRLQKPSHHNIKPQTPPPNSLSGRKGHIVVAFIVEPSGGITHAKVITESGDPKYDARVVRAVEQAHFKEAGSLDGKAVRAFYMAWFTYE